MILSEWPPWHPNQLLKAEHLLGLEDYLLSRVLIVDEAAYGVDFFDWKQSLEPHESTSELILRVHALRGVTPIGQPVWLRKIKPDHAGGWLETKLQKPLPSDFHFDLWIVVNDPNEGVDKLRLEANPVGTKPVTPGDEDNYNRLYLGRYLVDQKAGTIEIKLVDRPMPRRLGAFVATTPGGGSASVGDDAWHEWIEPLTTRLRELLRDVIGRRSTSPAVQALAGEMLRLSFEWPALTVPILVRRLRMIHWLWGRTLNPDLVPDPLTAVELMDHYFTWTGNALPEILAALVPRPSVESEGLGQSLKYLLDELFAQGGVKYHAPLRLLREWSENLRDARLHPASGGDTESLVRQVREALSESSRYMNENPWIKAVALTTAASLQVDPAWHRLAPELQLGPTNAIDGAAEALADLYKIAIKAGAGPLAFYFLAHAAERQPDIAQRSSGDVRAYFKRLEGPDESAPRRTSSSSAKPATDRVARFVSRTRSHPPAAPDVRPYLWSPKDLARRDKSATLREICITVVGGQRSGKTTLISELVHGCREPAAPRGLDFDSYGDVGETVSSEVTGRLVLDGRVMGLQVIDGGPVVDGALPDDWTPESEWSLPWRATAISDLLVIAIQPATIDVAGPPAEILVLRDLALWTLSRRPAALVAIAYTKADEYGVVEPQALRLVNDQQQAERLRALQTATDVDHAWNGFVGESRATGQQGARVREGVPVGGGFFFGGRAPSRGDEWVEARKKVLEQTRQLWEALACRAPTASLLNGYFISASPRDPYLEPWPHRGLFQMIADFIQCLRSGTQ